MQELLLPDPVAPGIYGRGRVFEAVLEGLGSAISALDVAARETMRFPPVISRGTVERCGYVHSFPHLLGTIHAFAGDDAAHARLLHRVEAGEDWGDQQTLTDLVLTPAACYALYPRMTGVLPAMGRTIDLESWCFRQEPSRSPERMRSFRMRELVRLGAPAVVHQWRDEWLERAEAFLRSLGLEPVVVPASDPFFGAVARFMSVSQRDQELKFELIVDVGAGARAAVMSCNYHREHFGDAFAIRLTDGGVAHTACVGFGLERIALGLLAAHGAQPERWPETVRSVLRLN